MKPADLCFLAASLLFYADYDNGFDASFSAGDGRATVVVDAYAPRITEGGGGRFGEAAEFVYEDRRESIWTEDVVRYRAKGNFPYRRGEPFDGAVGMWLQIDMETLKKRSLIWLDPVHLLAPDSGDRGKVWMDFVTKELPDTPIFRFGATLPRETRKNPDRSGEGNIIIVPHIDFGGGEWHHVVGTWKHLNNNDGSGGLALYFDGEQAGHIEGFSHPLDWSVEDWEIRVGLGFKGRIDEFFVLDRFVSPGEARALYGMDAPLGSILPRSKTE